MRGVSYLYNVRVAVIVFGNDAVRYFGEGDVTVYLYKFDTETHYDALIPLRTLPPSLVTISSDDDELSLATAAAAAGPGECTLPHAVAVLPPVDYFSLNPVRSKCFPFTTSKCTLVHTIVERRTARMQCGIHGKNLSSSEDDDIPLTATAAASAPGQCAPFVPLKCTLSHAVADLPRLRPRKIKHDSSGDSSTSCSDHVPAAAGILSVCFAVYTL
jgi:hypothetical protein